MQEGDTRRPNKLTMNMPNKQTRIAFACFFNMDQVKPKLTSRYPANAGAAHAFPDADIPPA